MHSRGSENCGIIINPWDIMKTYLDIINNALLIAGHSQTSAEIAETEYKPIYDLHLREMLAKQDWLFAFEIFYLNENNRLDEDAAMDLGWAYRYKLPDNVINVISDGRSRPYEALSPLESLQSGLTPPTVETFVENLRSNFVFTGGVLHSDTEVSKILASIDVEPSVMSPPFATALVYKLAGIFALILESSIEKKRAFEREYKSHMSNAIIRNNGRPADPRLRAIYEWIVEFRVASV